MTSIQSNGKFYQVFFYEDNARRLQPQGFEPVTTITCMVLEDNELAASGIAVKSAEDKNNYHLGMKLALTRAMHDSEFDYETKTKIWELFNDMLAANTRANYRARLEGRQLEQF